VPPLTELRVRAGLPPYHVSPELLVEHLLLRGELPPDSRCLECGRDTDRRAFVTAVCERARIREHGGFSWAVLLASIFFLPMRIWLWQQRETTVLGKDKFYRLPLPVCDTCRPRLRGGQEVREWLARIPAYGLLLDKFPDADLSLE
jgi:hypothetical protein